MNQSVIMNMAIMTMNCGVDVSMDVGEQGCWEPTAAGLDNCRCHCCYCLAAWVEALMNLC